MRSTDLARIRQGVYRLLAAGYGRPSVDTRGQILDGMAALEDMGIGWYAFANPLRGWADALSTCLMEATESEHVRLFGAGVDDALCPPIESQYLGSNLHGDPARSAGRVEDLMRRSGFSARNGSLPPDHLIVELELLSALCGGEAESRAGGESGLEWLRWQAELIVVLRMWVPRLAAQVTMRDRSGVFAQLANATEACVQHEDDLIRILTAAADDPT